MAYSLDIQEVFKELAEDLYFTNYGYLPLPVNGWGRGRFGGKRRGRGRGRGRGKGRGRGRGKFINKEEKNLHEDLIEPQKVFIANIDRAVSEETLLESLRKFASVKAVKIIRKHKPHYYNTSVYGFATLTSEEDSKILLNLSGDDLLPIGSRKLMVIKPAKKEIKLPGAPGYVRSALDDRDFDLEPFNIDEPCAHMLNDDVLLKIFDYFPLKKQISLEGVCRRWQNLIYANTRKNFHFNGELDVSKVFENAKLPSTIAAVSKFLLITGENIKKIVFSASDFKDPAKIIPIIAQLCPSLEAIALRDLFILEKKRYFLLQDLVNSCKKLKEFRFNGFSLCDNNFKIIVEGFHNLQILHLEKTSILGQYMSMLPKSLKELQLSYCRLLKANSLEKLHECTNLEILVLDHLRLPGSVITSVGKSCSKLSVLKVKVTHDHEKVDLSNFKSLKTLHFNSVNYSITKIIMDLPQLEEVSFHGIIKEKESDIIDFSLLENLKFLISGKPPKFGKGTLRTISFCKNLEVLHLLGYYDVKDVAISCIKNCPFLKVVRCSHVSITASDIPNFVEATKRRVNKIKLTIGLDKSALDLIEKLADAKYEIEMMDTFNLFYDSDDDDLYGGDDDDADDDDDDYNDYNNYDDLFNNEAFSDEDFEDDMENYFNMHELPDINLFLNFEFDDESDDMDYQNFFYEWS